MALTVGGQVTGSCDHFKYLLGRGDEQDHIYLGTAQRFHTASTLCRTSTIGACRGRYCRALLDLGLSCDIARQQLSNPVGRFVTHRLR